MSNIRTCLMNPYYKLNVYFLGPKVLTEIETLKAKLEKGAWITRCQKWSKEDGWGAWKIRYEKLRLKR